VVWEIEKLHRFDGITPAALTFVVGSAASVQTADRARKAVAVESAVRTPQAADHTNGRNDGRRHTGTERKKT